MGFELGTNDGIIVGISEGDELGTNDGISEGDELGVSEGLFVGWNEGKNVGFNVGWYDGPHVGDTLGNIVPVGLIVIDKIAPVLLGDMVGMTAGISVTKVMT